MDHAARAVVDRLFARTDDLVRGMLEAMRGGPSYAQVPADDVHAAVRQHVLRLTDHLRAAERPLDHADEAFLRDMGEQRARQGVTLEDLVHVWTASAVGLGDHRGEWPHALIDDPIVPQDRNLMRKPVCAPLRPRVEDGDRR